MSQWLKARRHKTPGPPQAVEVSKRDAEWKTKNYYSAHSFTTRVNASTGRQSQRCGQNLHRPFLRADSRNMCLSSGGQPEKYTWTM